MPARRRRRSPFALRRIALALIFASGLLAGAGAAMRAHATNGGSGSYLLDVAGLMVAIIGAVMEAGTAQRFFQFSEKSARRRALVLLLCGAAAAFSGCVLASSVAGDAVLWSAAASIVMFAGFGAGLAGAGSLAWYYGGDYAARRIEHLSDEDW